MLRQMFTSASSGVQSSALADASLFSLSPESGPPVSVGSGVPSSALIDASPFSLPGVRGLHAGRPQERQGAPQRPNQKIADQTLDGSRLVSL